MYLVMEMCEGGDLQKYISLKKDQVSDKKLEEIPEFECVSILNAMLTGLTFLKSKLIMHRDIKPGNVLLNHG